MSLCGCAFGLLFPSSKCDEGQFSNTHCPEPPLTCLQMESCSVPYNLWTRGGGNEGRARVGPRMRRPQSNTHVHECLYTHTPSHNSYAYTRPYTLIHTHTCTLTDEKNTQLIHIHMPVYTYTHTHTYVHSQTKKIPIHIYMHR